MEEGEALDRVGDRPFRQAGADVLVELEAQRSRAGKLDRTADPEGQLGRGEERLAPVGLVEEDAIAGAAGGDLGGRLDGEDLKAVDAAPRRPDTVGDCFEL